MSKLYGIKNTIGRNINVREMLNILCCSRFELDGLIDDYDYVRFNDYQISNKEFISKIKDVDFLLTLKGFKLKLKRLYYTSNEEDMTYNLRIVDRNDEEEHHSLCELYKDDILSYEEINYIYDSIKNNLIIYMDYNINNYKIYFTSESEAERFCNYINRRYNLFCSWKAKQYIS
jgi:hypothetical protein